MKTKINRFEFVSRIFFTQYHALFRFMNSMKVSCLLLLGVLLVSGCVAEKTSTPAPPVLVTLLCLGSQQLRSPLHRLCQRLLPAQLPLRSEEAARPSTTPVCEDNLKFVADLTVPDGTIVARGALIDKRWQVENNGSCNWDERLPAQNHLRSGDGRTG